MEIQAIAPTRINLENVISKIKKLNYRNRVERWLLGFVVIKEMGEFGSNGLKKKKRSHQ